MWRASHRAQLLPSPQYQEMTPVTSTMTSTEAEANLDLAGGGR